MFCGTLLFTGFMITFTMENRQTEELEHFVFGLNPARAVFASKAKRTRLRPLGR